MQDLIGIYISIGSCMHFLETRKENLNFFEFFYSQPKCKKYYFWLNLPWQTEIELCDVFKQG